MAINFPDSPNVNDTYTVDDKTFIWTGDYWRVLNSPNYISTLIKDADNDTKIEVEQAADEDMVRITTAGIQRYSIGADGHLIPSSNEVYDLGSITNRFRDIYLSGNSINLGSVVISTDGTNLSIDSGGGSGALDFATQSYVDTAVSNLVDSAPETLNTLNELSSALGDDPNFATTLAGNLAVLSPTGSITMFAGSTAPLGWLMCIGQEISRTEYSSLFAVIGTTYGPGNGTTTFNLPNLKGRIPVGYDSGDGNFNSLGSTGGSKTHTLTESEMPSHTHTFTGSSSSTSNQSNNHTHNSSTMSNPGNHEHAVYTRGTLGGGGRFIYGDYAGGSGATHWNPNSWGTITGSAFANEAIGLGNGGHTHTYTTSGINSNHTHPFTPSGTNSTTGADVGHNNLQPYIVMNYIIKV